jgi:Family of unknown function (DUF6261)
MIVSIDLAKLSNAGYIQFSRNFLDIVASHNPVILKVEPEYTALDNELKVIEAVFKTDQASKLTPVIEALDIRRDNAIMGIYKCVDGFTHYFEPAKKAAAEVLMQQLKVYGAATSITLTALPMETAILTSLVGDLGNKPELNAALKQLSLGEWVDELQAANELLNQKYVERMVETGNANPNTIRGKRIEAYAQYYALRDMLAAQALVAKNAPPYPQTINELNAVVEQYNLIIAGRGTDKTDTPPTGE